MLSAPKINPIIHQAIFYFYPILQWENQFDQVLDEINLVVSDRYKIPKNKDVLLTYNSHVPKY